MSLGSPIPAVATQDFLPTAEPRELFPGANEGLCRQWDTAVFFPVGEADGESRGGQWVTRYALARSVCAACSVKDACREYALARPEIFGVWGGTTPSERRAIRGEEDGDDDE